MASGEKKKRDKKKIAAAIVAVLCLVALIMAGTFAWYDTADALNPFRGVNDIETVLHDDYDWNSDSNEYTKTVYVENSGDTPVYVRMRLEEYRYIIQDNVKTEYPEDAVYKEKSEAPVTDEDQIEGWHRHSPFDDDCADCGKQEFHTYWKWTMGNGDPYEYRPAKDGERAAGVAYKWKPKSDGGDGTPEWTTTDTFTESGGGVKSIAEYMALPNKSDFVGWIYDTDGYAYWSKPLAAKTATSPLLAMVTEEEPPGDKFFYGINVDYEAVDDTDLITWAHEYMNTMKGDENERATDEMIAILLEICGGPATKFDVSLFAKEQMEIYGQAKEEGKLAKYKITDFKHNRFLGKTDSTIQNNYGGLTWSGTGSAVNNITEFDMVILQFTPAGMEMISERMITGEKFHSTNNYMWEGSLMRDVYLNGAFYDGLPDEVKDMIVQVDKQTKKAWDNPEMVTTKDKVYLLSEEEVEAYWPKNASGSYQLCQYSLILAPLA